MYLWAQDDEPPHGKVKPDWQLQYEADFLFTSTPNLQKLKEHFDSLTKKMLSGRGADAVNGAVVMASKLDDETSDDAPRDSLRSPELGEKKRLVRLREHIRILASDGQKVLAGDVFNRHEISSFVKLRYVSMKRMRNKLLKVLNYMRYVEDLLTFEVGKQLH